MDISSNHLRTFLAICEHRNFTLAAVALQRSQSNVSTQVKQLEDQIGLKLFNRDKRPFSLTEAGTTFLQFAREVTNRIKILDRRLKELDTGAAGEVKIGANGSIAAYLLPRIIAGLLYKRPKINIYVVTDIARKLFELVREGEIDFALTLLDNSPQGLVTKPLMEDRFCFVVSPKHPLARTKTISVAALRGVPFVVGQRGTSHDTLVQRVMDRAGVSDYEVAVRISTNEGVKQVLCEGFGLSVLPTFSVWEELKNRKLVRLEVNGIDLRTGICLVKRPDETSTAVVAFVEAFVEKSVGAYTPSNESFKTSR
jgi:DNA-binding transcriptional LysR family regulator